MHCSTFFAAAVAVARLTSEYQRRGTEGSHIQTCKQCLMTYALNGKENCRKRGLLPRRNGLCLLLTILNKIKPYLDVCENISHLMSPAKEVLEEEALLVPASPGATVPASLSGEGGRRPGRSRSSRKQSAGTPPPPCSGSPGGNTQHDGFCNSHPSSLLPILKDFSDREGSAKSTVNCYNRRPCP